MALPGRELHHLVLERRAVARPDALDLAVIERRLADVRANQFVHALRRVKQPAINLLALDPSRQERERDDLPVAGVQTELAGAQRRARSQSNCRSSRGGVPVLSRPIRNPKPRMRLGKRVRTVLPQAASAPLLWPHVDEPAQECAGRDNRRCALRMRPDLLGHKTEYRLVQRQARQRAQSTHSMFGCASSARRDPSAVTSLVGLRARRPDGRAPAAIEQLELDARRVNREAHQPAQRIDLANEVALRRSADSRIARHVGDGAPSTACRCQRGSPSAPRPTPTQRRHAPRRSQEHRRCRPRDRLYVESAPAGCRRHKPRRRRSGTRSRTGIPAARGPRDRNYSKSAASENGVPAASFAETSGRCPATSGHAIFNSASFHRIVFSHAGA